MLEILWCSALENIDEIHLTEQEEENLMQDPAQCLNFLSHSLKSGTALDETALLTLQTQQLDLNVIVCISFVILL